jgi:hypothetical protein
MWISFISAITKLPAPGVLPRLMISFTTHSNCTGDSATRGGFTKSDGSSVNPDL